MQTTLTNWLPDLQTYTQKVVEGVTWDETDLPLFYAPKNTATSTLMKWAKTHARQNGYDKMIPFIKHVVKIYKATRWRKPA